MGCDIARMRLDVRAMELDETGIIIDYFHSSTPEHLDTLGVDPTRMPDPERWRQSYEREYAQPLEQRKAFQVVWLLDDEVVGFSTVDKLCFGDQANMHLHIVRPDRRQSGLGVEYVRRSAALYFETLQLQRLFCQPNALNTAPNRTLQAAGFRYVKTLMTAPAPLNYRQPITRWVLEPG
jgi:RimJ/RimL family protein N-acetyltransferase